MLAKESGASSNFDLPEEVLQFLPSDPFEQLDVARKITSIALSTRVSALESELSVLQRSFTEKDSIISDLEAQLESLDSSLSDTNEKLAQAEQEKESLVKENASLASTVRKLNRDVAKLEMFRKTLMRSLQDEEENPQAGASAIKPPRAAASNPDDDSTSGNSTVVSQSQSQLSDTGNSQNEDIETEASRPPRVPAGPLLASQTSTPRLTPPGSPPSLSASASPSRSPRVASPRRHSISFSTTRGMFDDRSSFSMPPSQYNSMPGYDTASQSGRTRVDGKEFFRQVRSRLSYEQFGAFLANVKDLNAHKQTREETLRKAEEIFGPDNKDMYAIFEGLITRNVHS